MAVVGDLETAEAPKMLLPLTRKFANKSGYLSGS